MQTNRHPIIKIAMMYIIAWCISPPLAYGTIYRLLAFVAFGVIIISVLNRQVNKGIMSVLVVICVVSLYMLLSGDSISYRLAVFIITVFVICSYFFSVVLFDSKDFQQLIIFTFILCIIWNLTSLKGIDDYENVMRILAKNSNVSSTYARRGIGGYGYLYSVLLLLPIGLDYVLSKNKTFFTRLISVIFIVLSCVLIYRSQYFLAILIMILIPFVYFSSKVKSSTTRMFLIIGIAVIATIVYANAETIINSLMQVVQSNTMKTKLQSMYEILLSDGSLADSAFSERYFRYTRDFSLIFQSPIFGCLSYQGVGNHSHFLDFFAQYGIPMGCLYVYMLFNPFRWINIRDSAGAYTVLVVFVLVCIMNTMAFAFGCILYFILPIHCIYEEENNNYE